MSSPPNFNTNKNKSYLDSKGRVNESNTQNTNRNTSSFSGKPVSQVQNTNRDGGTIIMNESNERESEIILCKMRPKKSIGDRLVSKMGSSLNSYLPSKDIRLTRKESSKVINYSPFKKEMKDALSKDDAGELLSLIKDNSIGSNLCGVVLNRAILMHKINCVELLIRDHKKYNIPINGKELQMGEEAPVPIKLAYDSALSKKTFKILDILLSCKDVIRDPITEIMSSPKFAKSKETILHHAFAQDCKNVLAFFAEDSAVKTESALEIPKNVASHKRSEEVVSEGIMHVSPERAADKKTEDLQVNKAVLGLGVLISQNGLVDLETNLRMLSESKQNNKK